MVENKVEALISDDFFPEGIKVDKTKIFPMVVIATMSSGKSTLINALLGQDMLPNSNFACTALTYSILDDDQMSKDIICVTDTYGKTRIIEEGFADVLSKVNAEKDVTNVLIRSHVKGVLNTDKALLMIDTPGPNNSRDASHEDTLFKTISKLNGGLLLYVLNASQIGISDDKELLIKLKKIIDKNNKIQIVFALNKIDVIDKENESIEDLMKYTKNYIEEIGYKDVNIIPVSAMAALIFKKVLNGEKLTRMEYSNFVELYDLYEPKDHNMKKYAITSELNNQFNEIELRGKTYNVGNLNQAIENTGICVLEECIQKAQILSSGQIKNTIKVKIK